MPDPSTAGPPAARHCGEALVAVLACNVSLLPARREDLERRYATLVNNAYAFMVGFGDAGIADAASLTANFPHAGRLLRAKAYRSPDLAARSASWRRSAAGKAGHRLRPDLPPGVGRPPDS